MIYHDMKEICILFRNQLKSFIQTQTMTRSRAYERGFQPEHRTGSRGAKEGPVNLLRVHSLIHRRFILIFFFLFGEYFQLFLVYLEKEFWKIHLNFWIMVVDHHSHLHCNQEAHYCII
jgi:hypothetical protein